MKTIFGVSFHCLLASLLLFHGINANAAKSQPLVMEEFMVPAVDPGIREFWGAGKALYDPSAIHVPTFLVHAEWDADLPSYMLHSYFERLTNTPYKRCVEIGEGTHTVILEKNRMQLFQAVQQFLDKKLKPGQ